MNNKFIISLFLTSVLTSSMFAAANGEALCKKLKLNPAEKAGKQWEKVISNPEKLKSIGASQLSDDDLDALKAYLVDHAADSDQPTVPGK